MDCYTEPHWQTSAIIVIDTQNDTLVNQSFEIVGTTEVLPKIRRSLIAARLAARPIIHIVRFYLPDGSNVDLCRRRRVEQGWHPVSPNSLGSELPIELCSTDSFRFNPAILLQGKIQILAKQEVAIYKPRWGAFYSTPLAQHLQDLNVDTLVFAGCNYPNCPRTSIYEASERDYRIVLLTDAISRFDERGYEEMKTIGVNLLTSDEFAVALSTDSNKEIN